jgi:hypothetical protein
MLFKGQRGEKWRAGSHWVDRGAKIMHEAGERQRQGAGGAARLGFGLENLYLHASLGEGDGGGESVGAGSDDVGGTSHLLCLSISMRF